MNDVESSPDGFTAVAVLSLPAEDTLNRLRTLTASSTDRAIARLQARKTNLIFNDAKLEGNVYTEPEVQTLLEGQPPIADADDHDANQILALSQATNDMIGQVRSHTFSLSKQTSDQLHRQLAEFEALDPGEFRGEGPSSGGGTVDAMGDLFYAPPTEPGGENLRAHYEECLQRVLSYEHPAAQAVAYSAIATYYQFYFDGNKRTSRLMMNGHLLAHGFDALVTPAARQREYNRALHRLFTQGDPYAYMSFMLDLYDDQ